MAHIIAIANPGHCFARDRTAMLNIGLHVGEQLTGVKIVCQGVDDGYRRVGSEAFDNVMIKSTDHDNINHTREYTCRVFDGLATT